MTTTNDSSLIGKIQRNEARVIYGLVILTIIVASLFPTGLPIVVSEPTKKMYTALSSLKAGSVVWFCFDTVFVTLPETKASIQAVLQHLFLIPGVKIMGTTAYADGVAIWESMMLGINKGGKVYGKDYVFLGYQPGSEMFIAGVAQDVYKACPADNYGTALKDIPMMSSVRSAKDIALAVTLTIGPQFYWYARQIVAPFSVPHFTISVGYYLSELMPFYASGQLSGFLVGLKGGAEYETLIGAKGLASRGADAMSLIYVLLTVVIVGSNIQYWQKKFQGGK